MEFLRYLEAYGRNPRFRSCEYVSTVLNRRNEHCADSILGQHLSLCRKFSTIGVFFLLFYNDSWLVDLPEIRSATKILSASMIFVSLVATWVKYV